MWPFFILLLLTHGFLNTYVARTVIWSAPAGWPVVGNWLQLSVEGLLYGLMIIFRTISLVLAIPLVVFTTQMDELVIGLTRARVPYRIAFIFASTLRFVPLLLGEVQDIIQAQRLRGMDVSSMGLARRLRIYSRVAVPLILGALVRSEQIELVLAARAFTGSPERTYLHETNLGVWDQGIIWACGLAALLAVAARILLGAGQF
jgi:energy-coupling factor transport system permease protein